MNVGSPRFAIISRTCFSIALRTATGRCRRVNWRSHVFGPSALKNEVMWSLAAGAFIAIFFFHVPAWLMLGYWFFAQFLMGAATAIAETTQTTGGIAFWAHVGGFVAGVVMIKLLGERPHRYRYGTW